MRSLGESNRKLREEMEHPLRTVAAYLVIDQAILSKIEGGLRKPNRGLVVKLTAFFRFPKKIYYWLGWRKKYCMKLFMSRLPWKHCKWQKKGQPIRHFKCRTVLAISPLNHRIINLGPSDKTKS